MFLRLYSYFVLIYEPFCSLYVLFMLEFEIEVNKKIGLFSCLQVRVKMGQ